MRVTLRRVVVLWVYTSPFDPLWEVARQVPPQLCLREHSLLAYLLEVVDGSLFHHGPLVSHSVMDVDLDKADEIGHVDLCAQHREQLLAVPRQWNIGFLIHTKVHLPCPMVVIDAPLMEDKLLEHEQQNEGHKVLLPAILSRPLRILVLLSMFVLGTCSRSASWPFLSVTWLLLLRRSALLGLACCRCSLALLLSLLFLWRRLALVLSLAANLLRRFLLTAGGVPSSG